MAAKADAIQFSPNTLSIHFPYSQQILSLLSRRCTPRAQTTTKPMHAHDYDDCGKVPFSPVIIIPSHVLYCCNPQIANNIHVVGNYYCDDDHVIDDAGCCYVRSQSLRRFLDVDNHNMRYTKMTKL
ncbi:hypothetical protein T07_13099 [Trichinella nelsoni]|uniref:Uncharacterized protein n=1 Tax=Trichinella nelsoni TaxID=6336 RepID=A0A0V0S4A5_9BILA|nr:hypothetical protein T07_13099 [Trichinella nelsoni]